MEAKPNKTVAILSYIILIGPLIAMSMNAEDKEKFASFHIRQALGITITFINLGLIISNFNNDLLVLSMWIFISILSVYGMFIASKGEMKTVPIIGNISQKLFKNI